MAAVGNLLAMTEQQPPGTERTEGEKGNKSQPAASNSVFFLFFLFFFVTPGVHMAGVWEIILEAG